MMLVLLVLVVVGLVWLTRSQLSKASYWKDRFGKQHSDLLQLLKVIQRVLTQHHVTYWLHAGSLLGARRHRGFVPWDDDVDLCVLKDTHLEDALKELRSLPGVVCVPMHFGQKLSATRSNKSPVDLFLFEKKLNKLVPTDAALQDWPNEWYIIDRTFPLMDTTFENMSVPVPKDSDDFLVRAYGKDFIKKLVVYPQHVNLRSSFREIWDAGVLYFTGPVLIKPTVPK